MFQSCARAEDSAVRPLPRPPPSRTSGSDALDRGNGDGHRPAWSATICGAPARPDRPGMLGARVPLGRVVSDILAVMHENLRRPRHRDDVAIAEDAVFPGERQDVEEILGNLHGQRVQMGASPRRSRAAIWEGRLDRCGSAMTDRAWTKASMPTALRPECGSTRPCRAMASASPSSTIWRAIRWKVTLGRSPLGGLEVRLTL